MIEHIEDAQSSPSQPPGIPDDALPAQVRQRQRLYNRINAFGKDTAIGREHIRNLELASEIYHLGQEKRAYELRRDNLMANINRNQRLKILWGFAALMGIVHLGIKVYEWSVVRRRRSTGRQHSREWGEPAKSAEKIS